MVVGAYHLKLFNTLRRHRLNHGFHTGTTTIPFVRLQNLPWYKTGLVSRQVWHLLSKLQNWIWPKTGQYKTCLVSNIQIVASMRATKPKPWQSHLTSETVEIFKPALCLLQNRLCARSKTSFVPSLNLLQQNRLCACSKTSFVPPLNLLHQNRLCAFAQTAAPNRLCIGTKPAFSFWINISTVSEVRCDCQGLGLVARIEASILVFDTKQVLYWPVLGQIQFCSFDRRCKTCLDTKPVLYQGRFCSLTPVRSDCTLVRLQS